MKKLFLSVCAFACFMLVNAQNSTDSTKMSKDCITMKDGKVWQIKGMDTTEVAEDLTLDNGIVVMKDGNVKMKDGKMVMLKEGDCLWMNGKITSKGMKKKGDKTSGKK